MNEQKSILILSFTDLKSDPRVSRQIKACAGKGYQVTTLGLKNAEVPKVSFLQVSREETFFKKCYLAFLLLFRLHETYYWNLTPTKQGKKQLKGSAFDLIIANDVETLPLAIDLKAQSPNCRLLFDAHEYAPLEHEESLLWKLLFKKEKEHVLRAAKPHIDKMFTVCRGIASKYAQEFGLNAEVFTNATSYFEQERARGASSPIKLIHHGGSITARKIENMIEMMDVLGDGYTLDLMLVKSNAVYHQQLEKLCAERKNVNLIPPVRMSEIVAFIAKYDIGVYILEPTNFNNKMALPNKIFEFIQARLAIAIGPSPEMASIVNDYQIGVVAEDFSSNSLAEAIRSITTKELQRYYQNVNQAALKINSEENIKKLLQAVKSLLWE